jgi:hypothetical protein
VLQSKDLPNFSEASEMAQAVEAVETEDVPRGTPLEEEERSRLGRVRSLVRRPKRIPRGVLLGLAVLAVISALGWWLYAGQFESTDDAQIEGHLDAINARISGTVVYINPKVENNQYVEAGTLLWNWIRMTTRRHWTTPRANLPHVKPKLIRQT